MTTNAIEPNHAAPSSDCVSDIIRREPLFAGAAICFAIAMLPTLFAMSVDQREFQGTSIWMKPLKFEFSICVYLATLACFSRWLPQGMTQSRWYRLHTSAVVFAAVAEIVWIAGAAAYGMASHYNTAQPAMAKLYPVMGAFAVLLATATLPYGVMIWRNTNNGLDPVVRSSLAIGLSLTFCLTLVTAGYMSGQLSHNVGAANTSQPGLLILAWSRTNGDLRVAHFFATHAMHFIPAVGFVSSWILPTSLGRMTVLGASVLYTAFVVFTLVDAIMGQPFRVMGY
jgi:hypothetical protein